MKNRLYLVLALATLICLAGWTAQARLQKNTIEKQTWEFMEVELDARYQATPKLNQFGSQGWELVGVTSACISSPNATIGCRYWAYMKRPR
ncbi:MAG TPA: hypothetical protein VGV87_03000 [Blastocatellia bacterium]|nr:hypothetical protein [Blastocatellia bacterium]